LLLLSPVVCFSHLRQLTEKEDPYSYYRGKAEYFFHMTPKERVGRLLWVGTPAAAILGTFLYYYLEDQKKFKAQEAAMLEEGDEHTLVNWSGTHTVTTKRFYQPTKLSELEEYVAKAHRNKTRLRVIGAGSHTALILACLTCPSTGTDMHLWTSGYRPTVSGSTRMACCR
jgi:hypothetical protein